MRPAAAAALGLSLIAIASCGDGGPPGTAGTAPASAEARRLTAEERQLAFQSRGTVERYCAELALSLSGRRKPPSGQDQARVFTATDRLIELAREKPAARVEPGVDTELFLGDLAEDLEGSNCDPRLVERIDQGLATLAQP
jgi:hypothetical protein